MSNTYSQKEYFKWCRSGCDVELKGSWKYHRFLHRKTPRDSKTAKEVIQKAGHRRRRTAERDVCKEYQKFDNYGLACLDYDWYDDCKWIDQVDMEFFDEGKHLYKKWSDVWDYD